MKTQEKILIANQLRNIIRQITDEPKDYVLENILDEDPDIFSVIDEKPNTTRTSRRLPMLQKDLSAHQRVILQIMKDGIGFTKNDDNSISQKELCKLTGFSNKGIREMMEGLMDKDWVVRGKRAATWKLV